MLNDVRIVVSDEWRDVIEENTGWTLHEYDALILGLFNDCVIELKSQAFECESMTTTMVRQIAAYYAMRGPILFVSEMAATRSDESTAVRDWIRDYRQHGQGKNMWFINGRRYMGDVTLEGAAAPYYYYYDNGAPVNPTDTRVTVDALNTGSLARALPRCQGAYGGHADLLAWDIAEFLYAQLA